jgi:hypothetical protein
VIAKWRSEKKERQERARRERDSWTRSLYHEADFTTGDRRRHRILHALFSILEREGGVIVETERKELRYERDGAHVEFQLREKFKQMRRPLTEHEERWRSASDKGWRLELEPTGMLLFEFKTYSLGGLRKNWLETEAKPMETLLPGIFATFVAAIPLLVEEKRQRDETARRWREAEQRRAEEEQRRRIDDARWRKSLSLRVRCDRRIWHGSFLIECEMLHLILVNKPAPPLSMSGSVGRSDGLQQLIPSDVMRRKSSPRSRSLISGRIAISVRCYAELASLFRLIKFPVLRAGNFGAKTAESLGFAAARLPVLRPKKRNFPVDSLKTGNYGRRLVHYALPEPPLPQPPSQPHSRSRSRSPASSLSPMSRR